MSYSGTVRCSNCYQKGHNRSGCPHLIKRMEERLEQDPDDWRAKRFFAKKKNRGKNKKCSYCNHSGHSRPTCKELKHAKATATSLCKEWRQRCVEVLKNTGVGIGTLVKFKTWGESRLGVVLDIDWDKLDHRIWYGYGGQSAALLVSPVEEIGTGRTTTLQIPTSEDLFEVNSYNYYSERAPEIIGPISAEQVAQQVPASFLTGESCVEPIFKDSQPTKERPSSYYNEINVWCEVQGFYDEDED